MRGQYAVMLRDKTTFAGYSGRVLSVHRTEPAAERAMVSHQRYMAGLPLVVVQLKVAYRPGEIVLASDIDRSDGVEG